MRQSGWRSSCGRRKPAFDEGDIYDNYSTLNGGAIYASHNDFTTDPKIITLTGSGVFQQNQSSYGGGMYVSGNIKMVFAGNIMNNHAVNGVVRKLLIPIGWWKIEETSWTWAYDSAEEDKEKYKNAIIIDNNTNKRLEFTNVRRTDVPATSESVVVNEMKSSIAELTEE